MLRAGSVAEVKASPEETERALLRKQGRDALQAAADVIDRGQEVPELIRNGAALALGLDSEQMYYRSTVAIERCTAGHREVAKALEALSIATTANKDVLQKHTELMEEEQASRTRAIEIAGKWAPKVVAFVFAALGIGGGGLGISKLADLF